VRLRSVWKSLLGVLVVALVAAATGAFILYPQILKISPESRLSAGTNRRRGEPSGHRLSGSADRGRPKLSPEAREAFIGGIAALKTRAVSLTPAALEMEAARLVALADNGHTNVKGVSRGVSSNALPVRIGRFAEGYFVVRARPAFGDLLGAEIVTSNEKTPDALVEALAPFVGGPASLPRECAIYLLISPQALNGAGLAD